MISEPFRTDLGGDPNPRPSCRQPPRRATQPQGSPFHVARVNSGLRKGVTMAIVVLVLWLFTAGAGFYLLATSNLRGAPSAATVPATEPATASVASAAQSASNPAQSASSPVQAATTPDRPAARRQGRAARDRFAPPSPVAARTAPCLAILQHPPHRSARRGRPGDLRARRPDRPRPRPVRPYAGKRASCAHPETTESGDHLTGRIRGGRRHDPQPEIQENTTRA